MKSKGLLPKKKAYLCLLLLMMLVGVAFMLMLAVVDAFPKTMVVGFIVLLILLIAGCVALFKSNRKGLRITGVVVAALFILLYGLGTYYLSSTYSMFARISNDTKSAQELVKGVDVTEDSFNILITGIDQWSTEKGKDLERSDVNMVVTVSPKTRQLLLTSIPRDTYVPLHKNGAMDKLTHSGVYGVDETVKTIEDYLGIDLNYYVKMNFTAVVSIINAMDGVDVYSPYSFNPIKEPGWTVQKGWNHMNGRQALAFARERKAFDEKDSRRVNNQQRVVKAIINKMTSSPSLLVKYGDIMAAAKDNMETNMPTEDMQALVKMQLADLGNWDIESQKIKGKYDMDYVASLTQEEKFLVYKATPESQESVKQKIADTMDATSAEIAAATATRQKNSIISFFKGLFNR